jgi:hypothetical protein
MTYSYDVLSRQPWDEAAEELGITDDLDGLWQAMFASCVLVWKPILGRDSVNKPGLSGLLRKTLRSLIDFEISDEMIDRLLLMMPQLCPYCGELVRDGCRECIGCPECCVCGWSCAKCKLPPPRCRCTDKEFVDEDGNPVLAGE